MAEAAEEPATEGGARWQGDGEHEWSARVVLHCVLAHLDAAELWRCGAVCRTWRRATADRRLWRCLLQPHARPATLAALAHLQQNSGEVDSESWWREQWALAAGRWRRRARLAAGGAGDGGPALSCAALHECEPLLALLGDDARLTVWSRSENWDAEEQQQWCRLWGGTVSGEWRAATEARWAPRAPRLLLAGRLALANRLEVVVMDFHEQRRGAVACRATSSPGAAGCWVDDATFLTLELRLLAPAHACTTLWLNASTQETQSEHAGVTTPLLRIYNESAATISHVMVADVTPTSGEEGGAAGGAAGPAEPSAAYYRALDNCRPRSIRVLIAVGGATDGPRGSARALLLWALQAPLALGPLRVTDELAERVRRRRESARHSPEPDTPLDEAAVRALCSAPAAVCPLPAQILGVVLHPSGACLWASTATGTACVTLPALRQLLWVPLTPGPLATLPPHTVLPSVDYDVFVTPTGGGNACAVTWLVRGGARGPVLATSAPALATLLLRRPRRVTPTLLVLTVDALEVWQIHTP